MFKDIFKPYKDLTGKNEDKPLINKEKKPDKAASYKKLVIDREARIVKQAQVEKKVEVRESKTKYSKPGFNPLLFLIKLIYMVRKDIKILLRSKSSALIVLIGPLLIIFLVGMAFNTSSLYNLKIAAYSESYSELSNSLLTNLEDQQYSVIKASSEASCIEGVRLGDYHVCTIFPPGMNIENSKTNNIPFYVDESRINLASLVANSIFSKVEERSSEISLGLTGDILTRLSNTKAKINEKQPVISGLKESNRNVNTKVQEVEEGFSSLELIVNESQVNITTVNDELSDLQEDFNISNSKLKDIRGAVDDLDLGITILKEQIDAAATLRETSVKDFASIRNVMQQDLEDLNAIKDSLNSILADIGGVKITSAETIVSPITTEIQPITGNKTHLGFLFPTLVILVVMFISILLSSTIVIGEKTSPAYFRNFITPTSDLLFMAGTYLTNIILVLFQLSLLFIAGSYFMQGILTPILLNITIALLVIASVFIAIGMFIGYVFNTEETATLGAIAAGSIMLFFSNTILPIETLPAYIREIVKFNPFVVSESIFKKLILFNVSLNSISVQVYTLLGFFVIFFILGFVAREVTKRRFS